MQNLLEPSQPLSLPFDLSTISPERQPFLAISTAARKLVRQVELVAPHLQIATIEGEPGVGKRTLAELLHSQSAHARSDFHHYDACEWLLAEPDRESLSGFIYLDRVDLLTAPEQALFLRLIRLLQNHFSDAFALVCSSENFLRELALEDRFLPDLAFRLTAIQFAIPPLRRRREDIAPLTSLFLESICARYHIPRLSLAPGVTACLLQHDWPANARELSSVLESAALNTADAVIRTEDLAILSTPRALARPSPPVLNLDQVILNHVQLVLDLNHGNKLKTARQLGISRSTLYRLLVAKSPSAH